MAATLRATWNIDVQRQLSRTMLFDIGYYGNRALHLTAGVEGKTWEPFTPDSSATVPKTATVENVYISWKKIDE